MTLRELHVDWVAVKCIHEIVQFYGGHRSQLQLKLRLAPGPGGILLYLENRCFIYNAIFFLKPFSVQASARDI